MELMPRSEETAFEPSREGLLILAETELALEKPIARLREAYGDELKIDPPAVRYQDGDPVLEPHMGLRLLCNTRHFEAVRRDLLLRGATIEDSEVTKHFAVVRASAPLALLIGYPKHLKEMTDARTKLAMWLSHYAPVGPTGGDAA
jgi:hypothetical protein